MAIIAQTIWDTHHSHVAMDPYSAPSLGLHGPRGSRVPKALYYVNVESGYGHLGPDGFDPYHG